MFVIYKMTIYFILKVNNLKFYNFFQQIHLKNLTINKVIKEIKKWEGLHKNIKEAMQWVVQLESSFHPIR